MDTNYSSDDSDDPDFDPNFKDVNATDNSASDSEASLVAEDANREEQNKKDRNLSKKVKAKRKRKANKPDFGEEPEPKEKKIIDSQEEKKKSDLLWELFTSGKFEETKKTESSKPLIDSSNSKKTSIEIQKEVKDDSRNNSKTEPVTLLNSDSIKKVVDKSPLLNTKSTNTICNVPAVNRRPGISSLLNQLGKKPKTSVLEASKLEWNKFKKEENLEEELSQFNRGKHGYLERQDFLNRTDLRQFEIEKKLRNLSRK